MKRVLQTIFELLLVVGALGIWIAALAFPISPVSPRAVTVNETRPVPAAAVTYREPADLVVPEPQTLARAFGEVPQRTVSPPEPAQVPVDPVPEEPPPPTEDPPTEARHITISGRMVIGGVEVISAVDSRVGRAFLIGPESDVVDWRLVEVRDDGILADTGEEILLIPKGDR